MIRRPQPAHDGAAGDAVGGDHHLVLDHRIDEARRPAVRATGIAHRVVVADAGRRRLNAEMAVEPEDAAQQFLAEAVHHRHDDDQGGDAEENAEEGKQGDDAR